MARGTRPKRTHGLRTPAQAPGARRAPDRLRHRRRARRHSRVPRESASDYPTSEDLMSPERHRSPRLALAFVTALVALLTVALLRAGHSTLELHERPEQRLRLPSGQPVILD